MNFQAKGLVSPSFSLLGEGFYPQCGLNDLTFSGAMAYLHYEQMLSSYDRIITFPFSSLPNKKVKYMKKKEEKALLYLIAWYINEMPSNNQLETGIIP